MKCTLILRPGPTGERGLSEREKTRKIGILNWAITRMKEVSTRENRGLARASERPAEGRNEETASSKKSAEKKSADFSNPNEDLRGIARTSEVVTRANRGKKGLTRAERGPTEGRPSKLAEGTSFTIFVHAQNF